MDKKKIILIIGAIIAILLSVAVVIYTKNTKEKTPDFTIEDINLPKYKDILKDTKVNNLDITDVSLITIEGVSTFKATLKNNTNSDVTIKKLYVIFYEGDNKNKILALFDTTAASGKEMYINVTSETNLTNTTKIEYVIE